MTEPIPVRVTRYRCPFCNRSHSSKTRCGQHIARCWSNPAARGCKTCKYFEPYSPLDYEPEGCAAGVDLRVIEIIPVGDDFFSETLIERRSNVTRPIFGCSEWEAAS